MLKFLKVLVSFLIFIGICVLLCHFFPQKIIRAKNIIKSYYYVYEGDKEYKKQNLFGAIKYYETALKLYPAHSNASYNLGNLYSVYEDYESALDAYNNALQYRPKYINARIAKGILLAQRFYEFEAAIYEYDLAIEYMPNNINIFLIYNNKSYIKVNKAVAYYNMGLAYKYKSLMYGENIDGRKANLQKSVEAYKNALKYIKDEEDIYFNLALDYHLLHTLALRNNSVYSLQNYHLAKDAYCKSIQLSPFDYSAHYNLAILFGQQKNYLDAVLELEKAALIIDSNGKGYKARYIYDVLNETSQKLHSQPNYQALKEKIDKNPIMEYTPTFVGGKIVSSEELDKAMVKNLKTCGTTDKVWDLE